MPVASVVRMLHGFKMFGTSLYVMFNWYAEVSPMPFKGLWRIKQSSNEPIHRHAHAHSHTFSHHTQENCARITYIIFYLLLILFTSRCQFEWQVAEHFRVCLLASTWGCQSLTGIHSVCRREAAPRWLAAVCLSWKCSASAGQERKREGGGEWGSSWTSPSPASRGFYTISSQKWKCHGSVHLPNNWNLGQWFIYFISYHSCISSILLHINCCCCDFVFGFFWCSLSISLSIPLYTSLLPSLPILSLIETL